MFSLLQIITSLKLSLPIADNTLPLGKMEERALMFVSTNIPEIQVNNLMAMAYETVGGLRSYRRRGAQEIQLHVQKTN